MAPAPVVPEGVADLSASNADKSATVSIAHDSVAADGLPAAAEEEKTMPGMQAAEGKEDGKGSMTEQVQGNDGKVHADDGTFSRLTSEGFVPEEDDMSSAARNNEEDEFKSHLEEMYSTRMVTSRSSNATCLRQEMEQVPIDEPSLVEEVRWTLQPIAALLLLDEFLRPPRSHPRESESANMSSVSSFQDLRGPDLSRGVSDSIRGLDVATVDGRGRESSEFSREERDEEMFSSRQEEVLGGEEGGGGVQGGEGRKGGEGAAVAAKRKKRIPLMKRRWYALLASYFPILDWLVNYNVRECLFGDIVAALAIASLAVPQDLANSELAYLPAVNGLYCSVLPPVIYAILGTSRHVAVAPVLVVARLMGELLSRYYDPVLQPQQYYDLAMTATFFSGVIQLAMGALRLGFVVDFLSHATVVGFMAGSAITIGLSQLKGLLGYEDFTRQSDIISIFESVAKYSDQFNWQTFLIGISCMMFLFLNKILAFNFARYRPWGRYLFYLNALGPFLCVPLMAIIVVATNAKDHGVAVVGSVKKGLPPSSIGNFNFSGDDLGNAILIGLETGVIALTEGVAISRAFASIKGYNIYGNQEMVAYGAMNVCGSFTSAFVTTGSFARSSVNLMAGVHTPLAQILMSILIILTLLLITPIFNYVPTAVLSAVVINAVVALIDLPAAHHIWTTDKLDALVMFGAFFGILFVSIEIGLLIAISISIIKLLAYAARPHVAYLGQLKSPSHGLAELDLYPDAHVSSHIMVFRMDASLLFPNANYVRDRMLSKVFTREGRRRYSLTHVILDFTAVRDTDTTGLRILDEIHHSLQKKGIQLVLANPARFFLHKLNSSGLLHAIGEEWLFASVQDALAICSMLGGSAAP